MVQPARLILPEVAGRYGRSLRTVRTEWARDPAWPAPVGKRGRWNEYDAAAVATAVEAITGRPPLPAGDPDELLDVARAAGEAGLASSTIRSDISRGRWPEPDDTGHGVKRWKRSTVARAVAGRRNYRRCPEQ